MAEDTVNSGSVLGEERRTRTRHDGSPRARCSDVGSEGRAVLSESLARHPFAVVWVELSGGAGEAGVTFDWVGQRVLACLVLVESVLVQFSRLTLLASLVSVEGATRKSERGIRVDG